MSKKKAKSKKENQSFGQWLISWIKTIAGAIVIVMIINGIAIASFVVPTGSMENTVMTGDFLFVNKFVYGPSTPQVIPFFNIPLPYYKLPPIMDPEKGDVIVFVFPGMRDQAEADEFQYYLKRCVATAGDTLQIINNKLYVNGKESKLPEHGTYDDYYPDLPREKFDTFPYGKGWTRKNYGPIVIPKEGDKIQLTKQTLPEWKIFIAREGHSVTTDGVNILIDGEVRNEYTVERDYVFGMGDNRDHSLDSRFWGFIPVQDIVGSPIVVYWSWDTNSPISNLVDKFKSIRWNRIATFID